MAWEARKGRGSYYTRTRKVGGRTVREYVGSGAAGQLAAAEDARRRADRAADRAARDADREARTAVDREVEAFCTLAGLLINAVLSAGGYHRHGGEWRKRR
ncbi:MAG: hypothetical protein JWO38_3638 [Gemmataceae bacterium]|nr:hypothetical protein [Gemmataceae bacterium]